MPYLVNRIEKCAECLTKHPIPDWPWKKYDTPVYWTLPNDGALIKCRSCDELTDCNKVYLTQIPCGHRQVIHKDCVDEYWMSIATSLGEFKD